MREKLKNVKRFYYPESELGKHAGVYIKPLKEFLEKTDEFSHADLMEAAFLTFFKPREIREISRRDLYFFGEEQFDYYDAHECGWSWGSKECYEEMKKCAITSALDNLGK